MQIAFRSKRQIDLRFSSLLWLFSASAEEQRLRRSRRPPRTRISIRTNRGGDRGDGTNATTAAAIDV